MKKMNYRAPQIEVVRFDTEDILAEILLSGVGDETTPTAGEKEFDWSDNSWSWS